MRTMNMPGFTAEKSLEKTKHTYVGMMSSARSGGNISLAVGLGSSNAGWGYSHIPSFQGQTCVEHTVCKFICYGPHYPWDCDYHLRKSAFIRLFHYRQFMGEFLTP